MYKRIKEIHIADAYSGERDWETFKLGRKIIRIQNIEPSITWDGFISCTITFKKDKSLAKELNTPYHFSFIKIEEVEE